MWMLYMRAPSQDVAYWPGRRALAVLDAILWPALVAVFAANLSVETGLVGRFVIAACVLAGIRRCWQAMLHNEQYRFTTWRWATLLVVMLAMGALLRLAT